jgi:gamma-D-glutamyl-L-lysine dipeptidyl-peptidase
LRTMKNGIATMSIVPVRKEPSHRSELASQLLFGETYQVMEINDSWLYIKASYDKYEGWMDVNQHHSLAEKQYSAGLEGDFGVALDLASNASSSQHAIPIVAGSSLPFFDGLNFKIGKDKFIYNGHAVSHEAKSQFMFERVAMRYLNTPYLWGGRSPFGIDCSGFTQIVFKFLGIPLKRDAYQQAEQGTLVNFLEEAIPGDLAFFNNEVGKIIHVGILLKDNRIIHCSGKVRIDKLDHFGIYNSETKKYSHQLKIIKRISRGS